LRAFVVVRGVGAVGTALVAATSAGADYRRRLLARHHAVIHGKLKTLCLMRLIGAVLAARGIVRASARTHVRLCKRLRACGGRLIHQTVGPRICQTLRAVSRIIAVCFAGVLIGASAQFRNGKLDIDICRQSRPRPHTRNDKRQRPHEESLFHRSHLKGLT
jgi:hypothetical protein